jgi:hypothetical protein
MTREEIKEAIQQLQAAGYKTLWSYHGNQEKWKVTCPDGHNIEVNPKVFIHGGFECPDCWAIEEQQLVEEAEVARGIEPSCENGYVYVMISAGWINPDAPTDKVSEVCKIGRSVNPTSRAGAINSPSDVVVVHQFRAHDCHLLEKMVHRELDAFRLRGEFFAVDTQIAVQAIRDAAYTLDTYEGIHEVHRNPYADQSCAWDDV